MAWTLAGAMDRRRKIAVESIRRGMDPRKAWIHATQSVHHITGIPIRTLYNASKARREELARKVKPPKRQPLPPRPKEPFLEPEEDRTARTGPIVMRKRAVAGIR